MPASVLTEVDPPQKSEYNVVFEGIGTEKNGNYKGVRTWMTFDSEEDFEEWLGKRKINEVYRKDVSCEEAITLCGQTPIEAYVDAAWEEAQLGDGEISEVLLDTKLEIARWVAREAIDERMKRRLKQLTRVEVTAPKRKQIDSGE